MRLSSHLCTLTLMWAMAGSAFAQERREGGRFEDRLSVKLEAPYPAPADPYSDALRSTGDAALDALLGTLGDPELRRVFREPPRGWRDEVAARSLGLDRWVELRWAEDLPGLDLIRQRIADHPAVALAEPVSEAVLADTIPDDPDLVNQWAWNMIGAFKAWDTITESEVVTAVIDTGIHLKHDDLQANLWRNQGEQRGDGIDNDGNGYIDDYFGWDFHFDDNKPNDGHGHGTHCAGTVGAVTNNTHQVAGVCWVGEVMAVKILSDSGSGSIGDCAAGIVYAADNGASVTSMSWVFDRDDQVLGDSIRYSDALDVLQVAAAGNSGNQKELWPAAYDEVMAIIATDESDQKAGFSNYGQWCSMSAPGVNIFSTDKNDGTKYNSGTSMATPHVAGTGALVRTLNPGLDRFDARNVLEYSAVDKSFKGFDIDYGWGRLDMHAAVLRAQSLRAASNDVAPGGQVDLALKFPGEAGAVHLILPSRKGRQPGFDLRDYGFAGAARHVALNEDAFLWKFVLGYSNGAGVFVDFLDTLDGAGENTATFWVPSGALFLGENFSFNAFTFDAALDVISISCSTQVRVR